MIEKYYLVGYPIRHSLSPKMHSNFSKKYNVSSMVYKSINLTLNNFKKFYDSIKLDTSVKGLSITSPLKEVFYNICDEKDYTSKMSKSVSNISISANRKFFGLNFDGIGIINDLKSISYDLNHKNILIIGSGAVSRTIIYSLIKEIKVGNITVACRRPSIISRYINNIMTVFSLNNLISLKLISSFKIYNSYDLIINATSSSSKNEMLNLSTNIFKKNALAYDLGYISKKQTIFSEWCTKHNILNKNGIGMLYEINKLAFFTWKGIIPD